MQFFAYNLRRGGYGGKFAETGTSPGLGLLRAGSFLCQPDYIDEDGCGSRADRTAAPPFGPKKREVQGAEDIVQLSGGSMHMCGLRRDGRVMCWGLNTNGELGNGDVLDQEVEQSQATFVLAPEGGQSNGPVVAHRMGYTFRAPGTPPGDP
jgi:hypothetical protein